MQKGTSHSEATRQRMSESRKKYLVEHPEFGANFRVSDYARAKAAETNRKKKEVWLQHLASQQEVNV